MFYVGFCPVCGEGLLGVRMCATPGHGVIVCDECDAIWESPDLHGAPDLPTDPDIRCPRCQADLILPPAHWATKEDIEQLGWSSAIIGEGWALGDTMDDTT